MPTSVILRPGAAHARDLQINACGRGCREPVRARRIHSGLAAEAAALSRAACLLARPLSPIGMPRPDSSSSVGHRARRTIQAGGFKILLELIVRSGAGRLVEMPYRFDDRELGASKMSLREAAGTSCSSGICIDFGGLDHTVRRASTGSSMQQATGRRPALPARRASNRDGDESHATSRPDGLSWICVGDWGGGFVPGALDDSRWPRSRSRSCWPSRRDGRSSRRASIRRRRGSA